MFRDASYLSGLLGMVAFLAGAGVAASARCPKCRVRVFWWCVSKLPAEKGLETAFESENCPVCGYPDGTGVVAPGTAGGARTVGS